jgi:hypothetical protein
MVILDEEPRVKTFQMVNRHQIIYRLCNTCFDIPISGGIFAFGRLIDFIPLHHSLTPVISFLAQVLFAVLV